MPDPQMMSLVREVSRLVSSMTGIVLEERQFQMVESRLQGRMIKLGQMDVESYRRFFAENREEETTVLVSLLTTHHSFFFREYIQFEHLEKNLKRLVSSIEKQKRNKIRVWSAACSRGQEPYSLAMFLESQLKKIAPHMDFEVHASDVDSESVRFAKNGVYKKSDIADVPIQYLTPYFSKGTGAISDYVKVKDSLREKVHFSTVNLNDFKDFPQKFDVIFCRNVFIYFNETVASECISRLKRNMNDEGLFYFGVAENVAVKDSALKNVGPSVYTFETASVEKQVERRLKVFCVDDSPSILKILKNILTEKNGFEVIGTASNGKEALGQLKKLKPDVVTLDLHMPVMSGFEFLEEYPETNKVVVVSAVSRSDSETINQLASLGVRDYVEKPSIANLKRHSDEIQTKLRIVASQDKSKATISKSYSLFERDKSSSDEGKQVHLFVHSSYIMNYSTIFRDRSHGASICIWLEPGVDTTAVMKKMNSLAPSCRVERYSRWSKPGGVSIGDVRADLPIGYLQTESANRMSLVGRDPVPEFITVIKKVRSSFVVLEENTEPSTTYIQLQRIADDISPRSGFHYLIEKWLRDEFSEEAV